MEQLLNAIALGLAAVIVGCIPYIKEWFTDSVRSINKSLSDDDVINSILYDLRLNLKDADRVAILTYNKKRKAATMLYEDTGDKVRKLILMFKNIPTTPISAMLGTLQRKGFVKVGADSPKIIRDFHADIDVVTSFKYLLSKKITGWTLVISYSFNKNLSDNEQLFISAAISSLRNINSIP